VVSSRSCLEGRCTVELSTTEDTEDAEEIVVFSSVSSVVASFAQEVAMRIRTWLVAMIAVMLALVSGRAQAPRPQPSAQEALDAMEIVGYADRLTAQPGDAITFMVSSRAPRYRADIVRIVHGDSNTKGPGMKKPSSTRRPTASAGSASRCRSDRRHGARPARAALERQLHADRVDCRDAARSAGAGGRCRTATRASSRNGRPAIRAATACSSRTTAAWRCGWRAGPTD
jgi:hypothetical protein